MAEIPKQRVSLATKKTKEWQKKNIDSRIDNSRFASTDKSEIEALYDWYYGTVSPDSYAHYVTNPYNSQAGKRRNFPAKLRNYNILKPVIDLVIGEKGKRPFSPQVTVKNADAVTKFEETIYETVLSNLQQRFINELNNLGVETGIESRETPPPRQVAEAAKVNYRDARSIMGQEALNVLIQDLDLHDRFIDGFINWVITGQVCSYKGVEMDDVVYETIHPAEMDFGESHIHKYGEDAPYAIRRVFMTRNEIVDQFYDVLTTEQIDQLEDEPREGVEATLFRMFSPRTETRFDVSNHNEELFPVYHVVWRGFKKVGIVTYTDEFGEVQELEVDETYKVDKDAGEEVEWFWVNEILEGYRIDDNIHLDVKPIANQRTEMNNLSKCKLPYNRVVTPVSFMEFGIPYQKLYNIFHYRLEVSIAKNKDKIMLMEMNTIPTRHGWDEEKFMYYADAAGYAFIDSTSEGLSGERVNFNQFQVLDMSLSNYIAAQFNLLQAIKTEWEELGGITRQRKGQVLASDSVGATERAVFQSSVITENMFRVYDKFEEKDCLGLIDTSKVAWANGKRIAYLTTDLREAFINIDPKQYSEAQFGMAVRNGGVEADNLKHLKELTLTFAQNSATPSTIANILDSTNFSKVKQKLAEVEEAEKAFMQQQQESQMQAAQAGIQAEEQAKQIQRDWESEENRLDRENKIVLKQMDLDKEIFKNDEDGDGISDDIEREKLELQRQKQESDRKFKEEELKIKRQALRKKTPA